MEQIRFVRFALLGLALSCAAAPPAIAGNGRARSDIALYLRQCGAALACNGSYLVAHEGQLVYQGAVGRLTAERRTPLTIDTAFDIGAISLQLTAAAIVTLAEQGRLRIDDTIDHYIPDGTRSTMTIRELLDEARTTHDDDRHAQLQAIIASSTGKTYATFIRETFFERLRMSHAWIGESGKDAPPQDRAQGMHMARNGSLKGFDETPAERDCVRIYATTADLLAWARALANGSIVPPGDWRALMGDERLSQSSSRNGIANNITVLPDSGTVVVILTNNDRPGEVEDARNAFIGILRKDADLAMGAR